MSQPQPQSICILRLSAIGDVIHANAMASELKRQYPNCQLTWIIGKVEYQLMKHCQGIEFIVFDKGQGWRAYKQLAKDLKGRRFDLLLHMQLALRATIASTLIKAKRRIGFDKARVKEGQQLVTNETIQAQQHAHVADGFMAFLAAIEQRSDVLPATGWDIPVPEADKRAAQALLKADKPYFAICAAASKAERNWTTEGYAAIADLAISKGYQVVLCGSPAEPERNLAKSIQAHSNNHFDDLVGKTTLPQLLHLLGQVDVVMAPDTGPLHMAVSQGTAAIGLYAHSNPLRTGPYRFRELTVSVYEQCIAQQTGQQWQALRFGKRAKGEHLMEQISIESVSQAFEKAHQLVATKQKTATIETNE
ncbi:glycosyltransferase family 9 protein [Paraferrimonas haliotis]|uniref:glycosyltransferase family 9 protein n=1 Tax=Paraferrimonas haliotis TaxID=2013866 RepID=UPI000BA9009F|nr:glycosyltransferase family 9 protein [Paraferrimonas haliotis]